MHVCIDKGLKRHVLKCKYRLFWGLGIMEIYIFLFLLVSIFHIFLREHTLFGKKKNVGKLY